MSTRIDVDMDVIGMLGHKLYEQSQAIVFIREALQNSLDAESTRIDVLTESSFNYIEITVSDNGTGISDFQSYFLTIGGSTKRAENSTIGGFGIAKLAIMSMDNWSIKSQDGMINKQILNDGQDINHADSLDHGTILYGKCTRGWSDLSMIEDILKMTCTNCELYLNGNRINQIPIEVSNINGIDVNTIKLDELNGHAIVRLNGLFMFSDRIYLDTEDLRQYAYILDLETHLSPYDDNYPLTANREALNLEDDKRDYNGMRAAISAFDEQKQELEDIENRNIRILDNGFILGGEYQIKDIKRHAFEVKTWTRYIKQLHDLLAITEEYKIGLADCEDTAAFRYEDKSQNLIAYMLNPESLTDAHDKSKILSLAIHEITHAKESSHYERFSCEHTNNVSKVLAAMMIKEFRI